MPCSCRHPPPRNTATMTDRSDEERRRSSGDNARDSKEESSHSRLTSLLPSTGGGLQKPSSSSTKETKEPPQGSLLGLDRLAAQKRQTQPSQRQYRRSQDETPSHPGGVSREAQDRARERERRHRQQRYHPYHDSNNRREDRGNDRGRDYRDGGNDRNRNYRNRGGGRDQRDYLGGRSERGDYRRRDDYERRGGGNDSFRSRDRRSGSSMPPPSQVTPSTQSSRPSDYSSSGSFSSARSSQWRGRGEEDSSIDAPTPRRDIAARRDITDRTPARRRNDVSSSWDIETPLTDRDDVDSKLKRPSSDDSFERHFYLAEDEGHYVQDQAGTEVDGDMGRFLFNNEKTRAREAEMEKKRQENPLTGRFSARKSALQDDQHAWEENRLLSSGAAVKGEVSLDIRTGEYFE